MEHANYDAIKVLWRLSIQGDNSDILRAIETHKDWKDEFLATRWGGDTEDDQEVQGTITVKDLEELIALLTALPKHFALQIETQIQGRGITVDAYLSNYSAEADFKSDGSFAVDESCFDTQMRDTLKWVAHVASLAAGDLEL